MRKLLFVLMLLPSILFSQEVENDKYSISKCIDEMTDKVYYFGSKKILCISEDGEKGFALNVSFKEKAGVVKYGGIYVKSSGIGSCNEKSKLIILFEDGSKQTLTSWNDFNCEGDSFFDLANTMLSKMVKPIKKLMFQDGRSFESYTHEVSEEDKNFFIEIIDAINEKNFKTTDC